MKNALLYTFMTPVGKIDDSDLTHSQEIEVPKQTAEADIFILEKCKTLEELKRAWGSVIVNKSNIKVEEVKDRLKNTLS